MVKTLFWAVALSFGFRDGEDNSRKSKKSYFYVSHMCTFRQINAIVETRNPFK